MRISDERLADRWEQISGKYISIDHGEAPQVFRAATDEELELMRRAPELRAALVEAREALRRVDEIENSEAVREVYTVAHVHGVIYRGPTWRKEVDAALARIEAVLGENRGA